MPHIGPVTLSAPFCQAGLAGYSDRAMRLVARRRGCPYAVTEALLDVILLTGGQGLRRSIDINDEDHPVAGQIIGSEPDAMAEAAVDPGRRRLRRDRPELRLPGQEDQKQGPRRPHAARRRPGRLGPQGGARRPAAARPDDDQPAPRLRRLAPSRRTAFTRSSRPPGRTATPPSASTPARSSRSTTAPPAGRSCARSSGATPTGPSSAAATCSPPRTPSRMLRETGVDIAWIARGAIGNPWIFRHAAALLGGRRRLRSPPPRFTSSARRWPSTSASPCRSTASNWPGRRMRKMGIKYSRFHPAAAEVKRDFIAVHSLRDWTRVLDRWYADRRPRRLAGPDGGRRGERRFPLPRTRGRGLGAKGES